ncbi:MAG: S-layer homology domain-containing protein [Eubacterium sp.]|nr:S-layer homology domain-containing protein [Eubacterium sp.]
MTKLGRKLTSLFVGCMMGISLIAPSVSFDAIAATPADVTDNAVYDAADVAEGELGYDSTENGNYVTGDEDSLNSGPEFIFDGDKPTWMQYFDKATELKVGETVNNKDVEQFECVYIYDEKYNGDEEYSYTLKTRSGNASIFKVVMPLEKYVSVNFNMKDITEQGGEIRAYIYSDYSYKWSDDQIKWSHDDENFGTYPEARVYFDRYNASRDYAFRIRTKSTIEGVNDDDHQQVYYIVIPDTLEAELTLSIEDIKAWNTESGTVYLRGENIPDLESFKDQAVTMEIGEEYDTSEMNKITANILLSSWNDPSGVYTATPTSGYLFKATIPANKNLKYLGASAYGYGKINTYSSESTDLNGSPSWSGMPNNTKFDLMEDDRTVYFFVTPNTNHKVSVVEYDPNEPDDPDDPPYVPDGPIEYPKTKEELLDFVDKSMSKDKVNLLTWNDEAFRRYETACEIHPELKDKVNWIVIPSVDYAYVETLAGLLEYKDEYDCGTIIFGLEAGYYNIDMTNAATLADVGFNTDAYATISYKYTRDLGTFDGKLKAAAWQAYPLDFSYKVDIAEEVLGTSDPAAVQDMINTPEKFLAVAEKMKEAGYYMTDGETYNPEAEAIGSYNTYTPERLQLIKDLTDNGYDAGNDKWSDGMSYTMSKHGKAFGLFTTLWFNAFCMYNDADPEYGSCQLNYNHCMGPIGDHWGGTWLGVIDKNKCTADAAAILNAMCCDYDVQYDYATSDADLVNNKKVNLNLIKEQRFANNKVYANGEDYIKTFHKAALNAGHESEFTDVPADSTTFEFVNRASDLGLISGIPNYNTGATKFNPNKSVRRDQFAIMLFNLAKTQGVVSKNYKPTSTKLKDVTTSTTGYDAIVWADENGIVTGYTNGNFKPANNISRAQITLMLMRYAKKFGFDTSARDESVLTYADASDIQTAFISSVEWASAEGIMSGITKNGQKMVKPNGDATRTQCAIFMIKYFDNVELLPE